MRYGSFAAAAALAIAAAACNPAEMVSDIVTEKNTDGFAPGFHRHDRPADIAAFPNGAAREAAQAIADGDHDRLRTRLAGAPDILKSYGSPVDLLTLSMAHLDRKAFEMLIAAGADVNGASRQKGEYIRERSAWEGGVHAPIYYAQNMTDDWWMDRLLESGADPDGTSNSGQEALDRALLNPTEARALKLVAAGVDVTLDTGGGNTYAHEAAVNNRFNVVEALMQRGADMWATSAIGVTPVYLVANPTPVTTGEPAVVEPARLRLVEAMRETGPEWPPSPPDEVRARMQAGTWLRPKT